jgi:laminin alpha 1/2
MVFNLASHSDIASNATCGQRRVETFCKLVEHVEQESPRYVQCGVCDAHSDYEDERHPITNAIDGTHDSWQSPTLANGWEYNWVTVTLDLKQVSLNFCVYIIIVIPSTSPKRPYKKKKKSLNL